MALQKSKTVFNVRSFLQMWERPRRKSDYFCQGRTVTDIMINA